MAKCKDWGTPHEHAHGTTSGWGYHGCRCDECRDSHYAVHRRCDSERSKNVERQAWVRRFTRQKRSEGNAVYMDHGKGDSHRASEWAAQRRYRERNGGLLKARAAARAERLREGTGATRKPWAAEDLNVIQRDDITLTEMAYLLGRTPAAIAQQRCRLRKEQAA